MFWKLEDINFNEDKKQFENMTDDEKFIFNRLMEYQMAWTSPHIHYIDYISLYKSEVNPDYKLDYVELFDKLRNL